MPKKPTTTSAVAEVICPSELKSKNSTIKCELCGMDYTKEQYKILKDLKKLLYFRFLCQTEKEKIKADCACHECLYKVALYCSNNQEIQVTLIDEGKEYACRFYPSDKDSSTPPSLDK
ncbi:MAG: hypothetical protein FJY17_00250 [Bacteroidetes bacterium]|nr:hypothetical protein [Bacteroidota bacterium]